MKLYISRKDAKEQRRKNYYSEKFGEFLFYMNG